MTEKVKETEYYDRLGVSHEATASEIKKAYYKLAQIWHPDRVEEDQKEAAAEKFKEISEAYEVLSDEEKRKIYNRHGKEGLTQSGFHASNPFDFIRRFFGDFEEESSGGQNRTEPLFVTLADLYTGKVKNKTVERNITCDKCQGLGSENNDKYKGGTECETCQGKGTILAMTRNGPMIYQFEKQCPQCEGSGHKISEEDLCSQCNGKKVTTEEKKFTIDIQRGMDFNEHISFFGEADQFPGQPKGNMVFVLQQKEEDDSPFKRNGDDLLLVDYEIPLIGALTGHKIKLTHLDGREIILQTSGIVNPGEVMKISGLGMPVKNQIDQFGNLFVKFVIKFPTEITEEQQNKLLEIFPKEAMEISEGTETYQFEKQDDQDEESDQEEHKEQECVMQ